MLWGQLSFQDSASPIMFALNMFHDEAMTSIIMIIAYVLYMMSMMFMYKMSLKTNYENHILETVWTFFPALVLITLALPSLRVLYLLDELTSPTITVKATGHQWYWSYDYADFMNLEFDSYMIPSNDLSAGEFRLLEVDNRLVLPWGVETRVLITAADVLHSWTIPSMGVKADAVPGRLNQITLLPTQSGVFYGQCSEICGTNHSFMPIALESVNMMSWSKWIVKTINQ